MQLTAWLKQDYQPCIRTLRCQAETLSLFWGVYVYMQYGFSTFLSALIVFFYYYYFILHQLLKDLHRSAEAAPAGFPSSSRKHFSRFLKTPAGSCCNEKPQKKTEREEVTVGLADLQQHWRFSSVQIVFRPQSQLVARVRFNTLPSEFRKKFHLFFQTNII